jgi:hypothetical protein
VADPTVASRLTATGSAIAPGNSAEFAAALEGQRAKLAAAVKVLGIKGN